jgi:hypothetical protein
MSDDRRIHGQTHTNRINNWIGSPVYVEGCRRDAGEVDPMPDEPLLPFRLLSNAFHNGVMRRAGETVEIDPSLRGPHHAEIHGIEYPPLPPAVPTRPQPVETQFIDAESFHRYVSHLEQKVSMLEAENAALRKALPTHDPAREGSWS